MKVISINKQLIQQDNDRQERVEIVRARWKKNARAWVKRKYAALLEEKRRK
jgi:hypothetical protein